MRYDDRIIEQVQSATDIVEVISQYVQLKKSGRNLKANCPFHGEKTPSFMVQPEKQIFHCFGCGAGGNVFTFLMRYENMSFPEALRQLAEKANVTLPEPTGGPKGQERSENEQIYGIYQYASDYYFNQFNDPAAGRVAREYFIKRGFDMECAKEFRIGFAPDAWRGLFEFLSKKGYPEKLLIKSGLLFHSKGRTYDAFRGRLLFPIHNLQGKVVAFGGRAFDETQTPKYLNSPENPIFQKRRELFGLHLAKRFIDRQNPQILVVEGYFDFLRLYQSGFKHTVATLGTALGDDHVHVLKRFAEEVIVVYDGDKAGEAASLRGLEVLLEGGMSVKIAKIPTGFDPDDFVQKKGAEAFRQILSEARDFFDYKLEVMLSRYNRAESLGLMKITNEFLDTFLKIKNNVLLDRYLRRLAAVLGVEENSLRTELQKIKNKTVNQERPSSAKTAPVKPASQITSDELIVLSLAVENEEYRDQILSELQEDDFLEALSRQIFRFLGNSRSGNLSHILNRVEDQALKDHLTAFATFEWNDMDRLKAFTDCLTRIKRKRVDRRLEALRKQISRAEQEGDAAKLGQFVQEYQSLWREKK